AQLVGGMAANLRAGDRADRIWCEHAGPRRPASKEAAADVVRRHHQLRTAPGLVDTPVLDDVREPDLGSIRVERGADQRVAQLRIDHAAVQRSRAHDAGFLERERRREAVAELRGIGEDLQAAVTGVARGWAEERARRRRIEVIERLRETDREPSEL